MILINMVDPIISLLKWDFLAELNVYSILLRLFLAIIFGGILGAERAVTNHAAGFRTYIIVCVGSTIAMLTNEFICITTGNGDAARLGAQVISGIGFLGAGTILVTSRNKIRGLTTAAGLWGCACLGLALGVGFYTLAIIGALVITIVFTFLPIIENAFVKKSKVIELHVEFEKRENLKEFVTFARENLYNVKSIERNVAYASSGLSVYTITLKIGKTTPCKVHTDIVKMISNLNYVNFVEELY